jgi:TRAP-type C4-dicarboxylate transport system permease small subunit
MSSEDLQNPLHMNNAWLKPLEAVAAFLLVVIFTLLLGGVVSRYVFAFPIIWIDEVVSLSFLWFAMIGTAIAMHRNEHLRLTLFQDMLPPRLKEFVQAFGLVAIAAFLLGMMPHAIEYVKDEMMVRTPAMDIPNGYRVSAIAFGLLSMLTIIMVYAVKSTRYIDLAISLLIVGGVTAACANLAPSTSFSFWLCLASFVCWQASPLRSVLALAL